MFRLLDLPIELQQAVLEKLYEHPTFTIVERLVGVGKAQRGPIDMKKIRRTIIWPQSLRNLQSVSHHFQSVFLKAFMSACKGVYEPLWHHSKFLEHEDLLRASLATPYSPLFDAVTMLVIDDLIDVVPMKVRLKNIKHIKILGRNRGGPEFRAIRSKPLLALVEKLPDDELTQSAQKFMQHIAASAPNPTEIWIALQGVTVHWQTKIEMSNWDDDTQDYVVPGLVKENFLFVDWCYRDENFEILDTSSWGSYGHCYYKSERILADVVNGMRERAKHAVIIFDR